MSEKTLQSRVVGRAQRRGWNVKHVGKGIAAFAADGSPIFVSTAKNFPDLFLLNPDIYPYRMTIECKREQGVDEEGQAEYRALLNACGIPSVVIRPSDLRSGVVTAILSGE